MLKVVGLGAIGLMGLVVGLSYGTTVSIREILTTLSKEELEDIRMRAKNGEYVNIAAEVAKKKKQQKENGGK